MSHQYKAFDFEVKDVSEQGVFEGYASTHGNTDKQGDKVVKGAFARTLKQTGGKVPVLWQHRDPIGVGLSASEDSKGLYVKGQLIMTVRQAAEARDLTAAGAVKSMSIGYGLSKDGWDMDGDVRLLKDIDLIEYSLVTFPANPRASISRIKAVETMTEREFEELLRDVGFSKTESKTLVGHGFKALKERRDAGSGEVNAALKQIEDSIQFDRWLQGQKSHILRG